MLTAVDYRDAFALVPGLASRVTAEMRFAPLACAVLVEAVRAYHPCWADLPRTVLQQLDAEHCHGVWRNWVTMTRKVLYYRRLYGSTSLTLDVVGAALASRRAA